MLEFTYFKLESLETTLLSGSTWMHSKAISIAYW